MFRLNFPPMQVVQLKHYVIIVIGAAPKLRLKWLLSYLTICFFKIMTSWERTSANKQLSFGKEKKSLIDSWNQFLASLNSTFIAYYEARKIMISGHLRKFGLYGRKVLSATKQFPILKFLLAFLPFLSYLILFKFHKDIRHLTHLDQATPPNLIILSNIEHRIFFCHPHRILSQFANPVFDFLAAVPYLFHFPLPFLFGAYLALTPHKREAVFPFMWCAGWVNLLAVLFQTTFPTAPPWFADSAVLDAHGNLVYEYASEAGFKRMDHLLGISIFHGIYSKSPLKFGAFPSLHVAWPVVVLLNHPWLGKKIATLHVVWISLAAMYITHHYLIDVLGGILLVVLVRVCMLKVWSPFPELEKVRAAQTERSGVQPEIMTERLEVENESLDFKPVLVDPGEIV